MCRLTLRPWSPQSSRWTPPVAAAGRPIPSGTARRVPDSTQAADGRGARSENAPGSAARAETLCKSSSQAPSARGRSFEWSPTFPNNQQGAGGLALLRGAEFLHFSNRCRIERKVFYQNACVARLLADDLGRSVFEDSRAMLPGLGLRAHKIFRRLADTPDAPIAFAGGAEELNDFGCKAGRIKQRPAFIKDSDGRLPGFARRPL